MFTQPCWTTQENSSSFDARSVDLILKAAAHLKLNDEQLQDFLQEVAGSPTATLSYDQIRVCPLVCSSCVEISQDRSFQAILVSGRFNHYEQGRRFVAVSLAEAETIRRIMHMRLGTLLELPHLPPC